MESFNDILKDAKIKLGLNRSDFANLLGYPIDSVTKYYQGRALPNETKQKDILSIIKEALK